MAVVEVADVSRSYGAVMALNSVSFTVDGGVTGLLGPNGAGKSTLLRILTGELRPGLGTVRVFGELPFANPNVHFRMGVCPEQEALVEDLTGREFVSLFLKLRGFDPGEARKRADAWIERVGLEDARDRKIRGYSKGMRQRAKICFAFAHDPELLLLDEPLTGLDPLWRHRVQGMIREASERGATVLFSSHVLHEVEEATRNVILIHRGRVAASGDAREVRAMIDRFPHRVEVDSAAPRELAQVVMGWECVQSVTVREQGLVVTTPDPATFYGALTRACAESEAVVDRVWSPDDTVKALFDTLVSAGPAKLTERGS